MQRYIFKSFKNSPVKSLLILFLLIMIVPNSKGQVSDNFSDGDFTGNPTWSGSVSEFKINTSLQLQLNGVAAATSYLSTSNSDINNTEWDFWLKISLAPTSGNNERIYLVSDQADLTGNLNGYYIFLGTNKDIELVKQTGMTSAVIFSGIPQHVSKSVNTIGLKITRNDIATWTIFSDTTGGTNYIQEGPSVVDNTFTFTSYFGVYVQYTISDATKFYWDNFYVGPILIDVAPPYISILQVVSNTQLDVHFSEPIDQVSAETTSNYFVDNNIGDSFIASRDGSDFSLVHLTFTNHFDTGVAYTLSATNIKDLVGNLLWLDTKKFAIPTNVESLDIVINEIMYDPRPGGVDYIEIYNRSYKILDLKNLQLANVGFTSGLVMDIKPISSSSYLIFPGDYIVLTSNASIVKSQYFTFYPDNFIELPSMPAFYADSGGVAILDTSFNIIDQFQYSSATMQFPLLTDFHGVSLERINYDRATQDPTNWHSASQKVGFGTPGYKNSQFEPRRNTTNSLSVEPDVFSPNNDGEDDVVNFHYHFLTAGNVGTIKIYDSKGRLIRSLINNELLGTDGMYSWDGITDKQSKAAIGIYIVYLQIFNLNGQTESFKKTCVLGAKM